MTKFVIRVFGIKGEYPRKKLCDAIEAHIRDKNNWSIISMKPATPNQRWVEYKISPTDGAKERNFEKLLNSRNKTMPSLFNTIRFSLKAGPYEVQFLKGGQLFRDDPSGLEL